MAYCTITDLQGVNPKRTYSATSTPTQTQVETHIANIAAEIDTVLLGRGLTVPVTTPAQLVAFLKQTNAVGAAAMAEFGMFPEASGMGSTPQGQRLWTVYTKALDFLRTGRLPTAVQTGAPFSFFTENITDEPTEEYEWRAPKMGKNKEY